MHTHTVILEKYCLHIPEYFSTQIKRKKNVYSAMSFCDFENKQKRICFCLDKF